MKIRKSLLIFMLPPLLILMVTSSCARFSAHENRASEVVLKNELKGLWVFNKLKMLELSYEIERMGPRESDVAVYERAKNFYDSANHYFYLIDTVYQVSDSLQFQIKNLMEAHSEELDLQVETMYDPLNMQFVLYRTTERIMNQYLNYFGTTDMIFNMNSISLNTVDDKIVDSIFVENEYINTDQLSELNFCSQQATDVRSFYETLLTGVYDREIQIDEVVNNYEYYFGTTQNTMAQSVSVDVCPWNPAHYVVSLGIFNASSDSITANDILISFDTTFIASYRILGYEGLSSHDENYRDKVCATYYDNNFVFLPGEEVIYQIEIRAKESLAVGGSLGYYSYMVKTNNRLTEQYGQILNVSTKDHQEFTFAMSLVEAVLVAKKSKFKSNASIQRCIDICEERLLMFPEDQKLKNLIQMLNIYNAKYATQIPV
jgi:hypothetical protein